MYLNRKIWLASGAQMEVLCLLKSLCYRLQFIAFRLRLGERIFPIRVRKISELNREFNHLLLFQNETGDIDEDIC